MHTARTFKVFTVATVSAILFGVGHSHAAEPYQPVVPDPITELWRWHEFQEFKGLGLLDILSRGHDNYWFSSRAAMSFPVLKLGSGIWWFQAAAARPSTVPSIVASWL
jgi:hypothetical protein